MIKSISIYFVFLFIVSFSYAQNTFVKVLGRETNDIYNDMDETTDGGILFGGNYFNDYCLTRCNSVADTVWSKLAPLLSEVNIYDMCTLGDGSYALAGSKSDPAGGQAAVLIIDSACLLNNVDFYISDDGWSMVGLNVYPMPDSGVMFTAYEDGYTCSNVLNLYSLDKTLNPVWSSGIGLCDADIVYSRGYGSASQIMHFIKTHYYEVDSLGNWHENVPHIISRDINGITTLDSWQFIDKTFTGVSNVSDSSVIMYGYLDSMGSKQIHLLKLSKTGSVIWSNSFGTLYDDFPVDIIETDDNGFAVLVSQTLPGTDTGIDIVFYKLDSQGQLQFSQTYGSTGNETAVKMIRKKDGSLLILGRTNGFGSQVNMVIQLDNTGHLNPAYSIDAVADHYCTGETALLSVSRPALQYMWSTGETTSTINVTTSGNYDVTVIDSSGISHVVPFRAIYFDSFPDASLSNGSSISICDGQAVSLSTAYVNGNIYQWYNDGILIDSAHFNTYNSNQSGIYKVIVNNSCGSDTSLEAVVTFDICASVNENNIFGDLRVYPNPSTDRIIFEIPPQHFSEDAFLYVFNMEGKLMMEKKFSQSSIELSVSDFPRAVYSYMIQSQKESVRGVMEVVR